MKDFPQLLRLACTSGRNSEKGRYFSSKRNQPSYPSDVRKSNSAGRPTSYSSGVTSAIMLGRHLTIVFIEPRSTCRSCCSTSILMKPTSLSSSESIVTEGTSYDTVERGSPKSCDTLASSC